MKGEVVVSGRTGILPLTADLAFSVKLWPPRAPVESPALVSGIVLSVDAIVGEVESSLMIYIGVWFTRV